MGIIQPIPELANNYLKPKEHVSQYLSSKSIVVPLRSYVTVFVAGDAHLIQNFCVL
jgi:hypothetical protein